MYALNTAGWGPKININNKMGGGNEAAHQYECMLHTYVRKTNRLGKGKLYY